MALRIIRDFEYVPTPIDDKPTNGARMAQIGKIIVAEYNKRENKNFSLMNIDKAYKDRLCAGWLYHMFVRMKDKNSEKIIEKMVWKGSSFQVEGKTEVTERHGKTERSVSRRRIKKMVSLAQDLEERKFPKEEVLISKRVIAEEEFLECIPKGEEEYIDYTRYKLYFTRDQGGFFCYSFLHKKLLYALDDSVMISILQTLYEPKEDQLMKPTCGEPEKFSEPLGCCSFKVVPSEDLRYPFVLSFAWFFVEDYNYKKSAQLEFLEVSQANIIMCAGMSGDFRIKAIDGGVLKQFYVKMHLTAWLKYVEIQQVEELSDLPEMEHSGKRQRV